MNEYKWIIDKLPYSEPFHFVGSLEDVSEQGVIGYYKYKSDLPFYKGHFTDNPITPGVILSETMAQIGAVCLGIYLLKDENIDELKIGMSSVSAEFYVPVLPGEKVKVISEKVYFRFNKLKCICKMYNEENKLVSKGEISGMFQVK